MPEPSTLSERIRRLVPEVDAEIRTELEQIHATLEQLQYAKAVLNMLSPLTLELFRKIRPSNGFDDESPAILLPALDQVRRTSGIRHKLPFT